MQPDDHPTLSTPDRPQATALSWLKNPWVILIFGGLMLLAVWVGIGIWTEQRRSAALKELWDRYLIAPYAADTPRFPAWVPKWLGRMLPPDWAHEKLLQIVLVDNCHDDRVLRLLSQIEEIEFVSFTEDCTFSDDALLELIETHQLQSLTVDVPLRMTPQHLAALRQRGGVVGSLVLRGPFDERHLYELCQMSNLNALHLVGPITTKATTPVTGWPELRELRWDDSALTDTQFAIFGGAPQLRTLFLDEARLTSRSGHVLEHLPLESLQLEGADIDDALMVSVGRIPALKHLDLAHTKISDAGLQAVAQLPELNVLKVAAHGLTISSARSLRESAKLRSIALDTDTSVTDDWVAELVHERFERIELINSAITDEGAAAIRKGCPNVKSICLTGSRVTDQCLPALCLMPQLSDLNLNNTAITDAGLQQVELVAPGFGFSRLSRLSLSGTHVTREGVSAFRSRNRRSSLSVWLEPFPVERRAIERPGNIVSTPE